MIPQSSLIPAACLGGAVAMLMYVCACASEFVADLFGLVDISDDDTRARSRRRPTTL